MRIVCTRYEFDSVWPANNSNGFYHIISIMLMLPTGQRGLLYHIKGVTDRSNVNANENRNQHEAHTSICGHVSGLSFDQYINNT